VHHNLKFGEAKPGRTSHADSYLLSPAF